MIHVSIKEAKNQLTALARRVEAGERIVVTRHGKPVFEMVPHEPKMGLDWEAGRRYMDSIGVDKFITWVSPDFDDPLPEDFLITPLPEYALATPPLDDGTLKPRGTPPLAPRKRP